MNPSFPAKIEKGKLLFHNRDFFDKYIATIQDNTIVTVLIKRKARIRTTGKQDDPSNQNGYYWAVIIPYLCDTTGFYPDEMHHALKTKFLRIGGTDEMPKVKSTGSLTRIEFESYCEKIRIWALQDLNCNIPTVEDYYNVTM